MDGVRASKEHPAVFESAELQRAVKTAKAISKDKIEIQIKRNLMEIRGRSVDAGAGRAIVKAKYAGKTIAFLVNPKFILDALSGMKGEVTMRVAKEMIWMVCGNREAIIAQMRPG
jgi:DNA polymerase III sliding clamp (beta) subunit (PCNA family)